jgi:hypothetical protein
MKNDSNKPATPDIIWKLLIQKLFVDFLRVFNTDLLRDIIAEKTEFLDKELLSLTGKQKKGIVDILAKVYLKKGGEEFILFHVEVQGNAEKNFDERMYGYFVRIWDKYRKPVSSLAIIVNESKNKWTTGKFVLESYETRMSYEYKAINISKMIYQKCINSNNPVEVVLSILSEEGDEPKWKRKITAIRRLKFLGMEQEKINILLAFIDRIIKLSKRDLEKFNEYIIKETEEVKMILTSWEEKAFKKGIKIGMDKGIVKGIEKGIEKGMEKGKFEILKSLLDVVDIKTLSEKTGLSIEDLKNLKNH